MTVPGFPNFFMVYGPEHQPRRELDPVDDRVPDRATSARPRPRSPTELSRVEVRPEVAERYDHEMQERLSQSVWTSGCASWYQTPGGRVTTNWPGQVREYRERTETFELADHRCTREPVRRLRRLAPEGVGTVCKRDY